MFCAHVPSSGVFENFYVVSFDKFFHINRVGMDMLIWHEKRRL